MPKKQPQTHKPHVPHSRTAVLVYAAIAALIVTLGYIFVFVPYQHEVERQMFIDAEAEIEQVYEEKIAAVVQPDSVERDRSCRYSSRKSGQGDLTCTVSIDFILNSENSASESVDFINKILESFKYSESYLVTKSTLAEQPYRDSIPIEFSDSSCSLQLYSPITQSSYDGGVEGLLSCTKSAKAEHFSLAD